MVQHKQYDFVLNLDLLVGEQLPVYDKEHENCSQDDVKLPNILEKLQNYM